MHDKGNAIEDKSAYAIGTGLGSSPNTAFVMILVYSGAKYIRLVNRCDLRSLERYVQCIPLLGGVHQKQHAQTT